MRPCFATLLLASSCLAVPAHAIDQPAMALLHQALEAQGGEAKLRALHSVQFEASGYRNELEESERPEGPYITEFDTFSEMDDFTNQRYRNVTEAEVYPVFKSKTGSVVDKDVSMRLAGEQQAAGTPQQVQLTRERIALSPERVLLTALDAGDVHMEADIVLQSVSQKIVAFSLDDAPVRIYLNAYTLLPTAVDYSGPLARSSYWNFLGDVTMRTYYSFWWLAKGGIHFPMQWNIENNNLPDKMLVIRKLDIDAPLDEAKLAIPDTIRAKFDPHAPPNDLEKRPLGNPKAPAKELAPGIVLIPGSWNATFVRQKDGIVILESPISSGYSALVIAEAQRRFPGQRIKAVITTSDSWPHLAGIREFVAKGIPIYALDLNRPILERVIAEKRTAKPDALARAPKLPDFHLIHEKTTLGSGPNRMEIYPLRGETSERQMMVYFPEHKLLYGSDPFQQNDDGSLFYPQTVTELTDAVTRENLTVNSFFMMHVGLTPWLELPKAIAQAKAQNTPTGTLLGG